MKIICYIFSIYIITLLTYPCQDGKDIASLNNTEQSANHSHNDKDCHTCPPFCVCNCCHVNTIITLKTYFKVIETIPVEIFSVYKVISLKDIVFSIWQPPKI